MGKNFGGGGGGGVFHGKVLGKGGHGKDVGKRDFEG